MTDSLDERPLTLREAADLYRLKISTLRAEAARGRLDIFRLGKRDYTTLESLRIMVRKCRDADPRRASISTAPEQPGLSETARASCARDALNQTVLALRNGLPNISRKNTGHSKGPGPTR
jgi:hypothetical protein